MNERQIKALNTLYAATIEVMEAFAPENVGEAQRREALSRMIENFLITASSPQEGIVYSDIPRGGLSEARIARQEPQYTEPVGSQTPSDTASEGKTAATTAQPDVEVKPAVQTAKEEEIRFAVSPIAIDNDYYFKRLKQSEDLDGSTSYPYQLQISDDKGTFTIDTLLEDYGQEEYRKTFPEMVVELVAGDVASTEAKKLVTVSKGEVVKDGKSWKVIKRVKVRKE